MDMAETAAKDHPDAVVTIIDGDGVFRYVSPSVQTIAGYLPADQVGHHFAEFYNAIDAAHFQLALSDAELFGESGTVTRYVRCKEGGYQCMSGKSNYVIDPVSNQAYLLQIGYPVANRPYV
jgi:PAS domain S-box-containing protein